MKDTDPCDEGARDAPKKEIMKNIYHMLALGLLACNAPAEEVTVQGGTARVWAAKDEQIPMRTCVPGIQAGPIVKAMTEAEVVALFGEQHVRMAADTCFFMSGTEQEAYLVWADDEHTSVKKVVIGPAGTAWRTVEGIAVGTPLDDLRRLNGRDFEVEIGRDSVGVVSDWQGGSVHSRLQLSVDRGLVSGFVIEF
jgi:hypothetical protein